MHTAYIRLHPTNLRPAWCDRCHTTAAIDYYLATISDQGVATVGHGTYCQRCDEGDDA